MKSFRIYGFIVKTWIEMYQDYRPYDQQDVRLFTTAKLRDEEAELTMSIIGNCIVEKFDRLVIADEDR